MIARRYRSICQFFRSCRGQVVLEASRASGWRGACRRSSEKQILALGGAVRAADPLRNKFSPRGGAVRAADPLRNKFSPWVARCVPPILWETNSRLGWRGACRRSSEKQILASGWRGACRRSSEKQILALGGAVRAADPLRNKFSPWLWACCERSWACLKTRDPFARKHPKKAQGENIPLFWGPWNTTIHHLQPQKSIYTFGCFNPMIPKLYFSKMFVSLFPSITNLGCLGFQVNRTKTSPRYFLGASSQVS